MIGTFENGQNYRFYQELTTQILALVQQLQRERPDDLSYRDMDFSHVLECQLYFSTVLDEAMNRLEAGLAPDDTAPISSDLAVLLAHHWFGEETARPFERRPDAVLAFMKMIKRRLNWRFAWSARPPKVIQTDLPPQCEVLFYTRSKRFADYLAPLRERLPGRSAYLLPAEAHGLQQELASLGVPFIAAASARTRYRSPQSLIGRYAPHLAFFADGVETVLRRIKPRAILLPEGNSPDDEVVNQVGKKLGIPVACLQQGWSPILHPGFRNLDYADFLVWGEGFADLFSQSNPQQTFTPVGNMALTFGFLPPTERPSGVLFFHQDMDRGLGGRRGSDMMISLAEQIAAQMPHIPVFYRPHPLVPLEEAVQKRFVRFPNIVIQAPGECPLAKALRQVCVSVSIYSTTILESAAAGVVPMIFNMTTMPRFWPNMSATGAAIESRTTEEALETLIRLLSDRKFLASYTDAMRAFSDHFFCSRGNQAMDNILERVHQSAGTFPPLSR